MSHLANPDRFERLTSKATPICAASGGLLLAVGVYLALFVAPSDYQQGDSVRIMYVHVPAAWMALFVYSVMAVCSAVGFVWRHPLADVAAKSAAPVGAAFTFLALVTGALWGRPMWGTWWAWDARLTSVLVLFFLYVGYVALWSAIEDKNRAARIAAIACLIGFVNIPVIKFSVDWWNTLHQPASILRSGGPSIHGSMLTPLFVNAFSYVLIFVALTIALMRAELAERRIARLQQIAEAPSTATIL
jgi:heme exporter protein C